MSETFVWGALLRLMQACLQASPFLLTGLIVAGVLRRLLGPENTRRLFGEGTWHALPQAWAVGMLLPVCSLGVIPVVRELRKAGLSGGTILAFALSAPLFNPLSLLYGLTLSEPRVILVFAFCSLIVITVVGFVWDRIFRHTAEPEAAPPEVPYGVKRLLAIGTFGAREMVGGTMLYVLAGLAGVASMSLYLPHGSLQGSVNGDNPYATLTMTGVAVPAYATPMLAMSQLGSMFQHGNSVGAAFALLALGAGMNLGLAAWMYGSYGWRRASVWFAMLIAVVVGLSYGVQNPLTPRNVDPADHTHAFDIYCQPFHGTENNPAEYVWLKLRQDAQVFEMAGAGGLLLLFLVGCGLRFCDRDRRIEAWFERAPAADTPKGRFDVVVPTPVLGGVSLLVIIGVSVAGCFVYYPGPDEVLEELRIWHVEAVSAALTKDEEMTERMLAITDDWSRKLEVGTYIRRGSLSEYHRAKGDLFRFKLELLKHDVESQSEARIKAGRLAVSRAYRRLHSAYELDL